MKLSETYVLNRSIEVITSITDPKQAIMAQRYCHLLAQKTYDHFVIIDLIRKIQDMIEIKLKQWLK